MARIAGIDLPKDKRIEIGLTISMVLAERVLRRSWHRQA